MRMGLAGPAASAGTRHAAAGVAAGSIARGGGESGKLLGELLGLAVGTGGATPITGANEDLAVALALPTMKLVDRHARNYSLGQAVAQTESDATQQESKRIRQSPRPDTPPKTKDEASRRDKKNGPFPQLASPLASSWTTNWSNSARWCGWIRALIATVAPE